MLKKICTFVCVVMIALPVKAEVMDYSKYFKVDMNMELPEFGEYLSKFQKENPIYDTGYKNRKNIGNKFKVEFSRTIKKYGMSEGRIKATHEDMLLDLLSALPKEIYQYIGPRMHEVYGMSEKVLNLPGIKETKNQFPQRVAKRMQKIENIEYLSPALYFLLMPEVWGENEPQDKDELQEEVVKKPRIRPDIPDYLKEKVGIKVPEPGENKVKAGAQRRAQYRPNIRTLNPTLTSPLTAADASAFVDSIEEIIAWGYADELRVMSSLVTSEVLLNIWEQEQGTALLQNTLKDMVNPCQRLVIKIKFAGLYEEFKFIISKYGYTPEEWAYIGDKTIKAFRVAIASPQMSDAVRYHRKGYYNEEYNKLPKQWRDEYYVTRTAIIRMYAVFREDVEVVRPISKSIEEKFNKINGVLLTSPIFY